MSGSTIGRGNKYLTKVLFDTNISDSGISILEFGVNNFHLSYTIFCGFRFSMQVLVEVYDCQYVSVEIQTIFVWYKCFCIYTSLAGFGLFQPMVWYWKGSIYLENLPKTKIYAYALTFTPTCQKWYQVNIYRVSIPVWLRAIIFGAKWLRTEWNPSRQLVWDTGDACLIPFSMVFFRRASFTLSWTGVSDSKRKYQMSHNCKLHANQTFQGKN